MRKTTRRKMEAVMEDIVIYNRVDKYETARDY